MKKIFKSIACCCLSIALAIGCCFGAMKMSKNQRFLGTSCNKASAYVLAQNSFISSYFGTILPSQNNWNSTQPPISVNGSTGTRWLYSFKLDLITSANGYSISLGLNAFPNGEHTTYNYDSGNYAPGSSASVTFGGGSLETIQVLTIQRAIPLYNYSDTHTGYYTGVYLSVDRTNVSSSNYHNLDMQYVEIGNSTDYVYDFPFSSEFTNYNYFRYTDSNNCHLTIFIPLNNYDPTDFYYSPNFFEYRIYYLNQSAQFESNDFYKQGLQDGYNNGYDVGETDGYNNGYSQGKTEGYNNGYTQGLESSERLGFPALITSVIDVPVKVFTSLFNFEILGVNILTFVTSLLTIALILAIVRKVKSD